MRDLDKMEDDVIVHLSDQLFALTARLFTNFPRTECVMDLQQWESLWKIFATIGIRFNRKT